MRHIRKYKQEKAEEDRGSSKIIKDAEGSEDEKSLYDADPSDLDSSDLGESEKEEMRMRKSIKFKSAINEPTARNQSSSESN